MDVYSPTGKNAQTNRAEDMLRPASRLLASHATLGALLLSRSTTTTTPRVAKFSAANGSCQPNNREPERFKSFQLFVIFISF
jgi:hypothetical protein